MALCCWINCLKGWLFIVIPIILPLALMRLKRFWNRRGSPSSMSSNQGTVAFFHPYCNAGGGGERVLWEMVKLLQEKTNLRIVVYTGDVNVTPQDILSKVAANLKIDLQPTIQFVYLYQRNWVEASRYPYLTLLGQSLGSLILTLEAVLKFTPDYFIDSMGYSWSYPLVKILCGSRVCCYTHYPTISTDMLNLVSSSSESFNNRPFIARSPFLTRMKIAYYHLYAYLYGWAGYWSDLVIVNSSWTKGHIDKLWSLPDRTHLIFPPCDTSAFESLQTADKLKGQMISIAQFRPEKNHELQLRAFHRFLELVSGSPAAEESKLVLIGSSRNTEDEERVEKLKNLARQLGLEGKVEIQVNISFQQLLTWMEKSSIGIHSMTNEHFGIGIVEMMAAGIVVIAHASGGPKLDIINNGKSGFLASDIEEYAQLMANLVTLEDSKLNTIRQEARSSVRKFSQDAFRHRMRPLFEKFFREPIQ